MKILANSLAMLVHRRQIVLCGRLTLFSRGGIIEHRLTIIFPQSLPVLIEITQSKFGIGKVLLRRLAKPSCRLFVIDWSILAREIRPANLVLSFSIACLSFFQQ